MGSRAPLKPLDGPVFVQKENTEQERTEVSELTAALAAAGRVRRAFPTGHLWKVQLSPSPVRGVGVDADGRHCVPVNE